MTANDVVQRLSTMLQQLSPEEIENFYSSLAPIVANMAKTGIGTDACMEQGCLPLEVHFYSPVPDVSDLKQRKIYDRISDLAGVVWDLNQQVELLLFLGRRFGKECNWSPNPTTNPDEFYTENNSFSFGCAAALHCMLRFSQPGRVIEIGSGNSSKIINAALLKNVQEWGTTCEYTIVDPYPDEARIGRLTGVGSLCKQRVETLPVSFFTSLKKGDILFIDSGHVVKTGGDVNFLVLDVLPKLAPGVIIHFHDISMPAEYAEVYHTNPSFRVFWTESYLIQAFLAFNHEFEILISMAGIMMQKYDDFRAAFPLYDPTRHLLSSGSLWLRRRES